MSVILDQIVEETWQFPDTFPIMLAKQGADDAPRSPAWRVTLRRRVEDIRSGRELGIDGEEVMARARKLVGRAAVNRVRPPTADGAVPNRCGHSKIPSMRLPQKSGADTV